ncbi:MAG: hypothetical protein SFT92_08145 [Rickettsiales bacterium]|nr:hypothetical protein [Rickettsiales bacterium]
MNNWHRISLHCALFPLITGLVIFIAWIASKAFWLLLLGVIAMLMGSLLYMVGMLALIPATIKARKTGMPYLRKTIGLFVLLSLNIPMAIGMTTYASYLDVESYTRHSVTVVNNTDRAINKIIITDPEGNPYTIDNISPLSQSRYSFGFQGEGEVRYAIESTGMNKTGVLIDYIRDHVGDKVDIVIQPTGDITIIAPPKLY